MTYPGITFPPNLSDLVKYNFEPLLANFRIDTKGWAPLFLSLWGKANVIKMTCAPEFNYLLQALVAFFYGITTPKTKITDTAEASGSQWVGSPKPQILPPSIQSQTHGTLVFGSRESPTLVRPREWFMWPTLSSAFHRS